MTELTKEECRMLLHAIHLAVPKEDIVGALLYLGAGIILGDVNKVNDLAEKLEQGANKLSNAD